MVKLYNVKRSISNESHQKGRRTMLTHDERIRLELLRKVHCDIESLQNSLRKVGGRFANEWNTRLEKTAIYFWKKINELEKKS